MLINNIDLRIQVLLLRIPTQGGFIKLLIIIDLKYCLMMMNLKELVENHQAQQNHLLFF